MAINYGFPVTYQQYYPQQAYQQQQQQNTGIIWVQGEAGAKSYLVAPNTTVQLWDSENQVIYLKSADASGMPSMRTLDYTIRGANLPVNDVSSNSGKDVWENELNALKAKIERLEGELDELRRGKDESTV